MPFTDSDVAEVRHVVQRILVPCVFVVGLLGNSVSIYVLTRKRMRCTTNIYLTALAITDIIYLTMALLLSLKHSAYMQRHCEIYWQQYGTVTWLCDACAYISIYIAVCFTIERFIAIRYPLKRQTFCTESLAKRVIAGVVLFCLLSTISTAFEHEYRVDFKLIDRDGRPCSGVSASGDSSAFQEAASLNASSSAEVNHITGTDSSSSSINNNNNFYGSGEGVQADDSVAFFGKTSKREIEHSAVDIPTIDKSEFLHDAEFVATSKSGLQGTEKFGATNNDTMTAALDYCQNVTLYTHSYSTLAQNELYTRVWYFCTLFVFVLIPLCVLATFNFFLVLLVRRSKNLRGEMTNANSIRRPKRKSALSGVSQENRVTITLIAVVLFFIVCQLPWAIYLIVSEHVAIDANLQAIIGNVFNFLAAINAAANFFLYCVLSDKYRSMVRQLITGYRYRGQSRYNNNYNNTNLNTSLYASTVTSNGSGGGGGGGSSRRYRPTIIK